MSTRATRRAVLGAGAALSGGRALAAARPSERWERVSAAAAFPGAYGFPVHVAGDGRFVALHPQGAWESRDGARWTPTGLPTEGVNHAYRPLVQHAGATWTLGRFAGDYQRFSLDGRVRRTRDHRTWETVGDAPTLPRTLFPAVASFRGALWMFGGLLDGRVVRASWRSVDGLAWQRLADPPWSPRARMRPVVFAGRLWLIGGDRIDDGVLGDVWSTADGLAWWREAERLATPQPYGYTAQAFAGRIWLVGANRSGGFGSGMLVSADGRDWRPVTAPWSPRGLPAVWAAGDRLFLTGGKFSRPGRGGEPEFIYANDVWAMRA